MEAKEFVNEMKIFLDKEFPGYTLFIPDPQGRKSFSFYIHYPSARISVVVYPSIRYVKGRIEFVSRRLKVLVFRMETREWLFGLKHVNRANWQKGIRERLIALRELARDVKPCEVCRETPYVRRYFSKKDSKGTKFVSCFCPNCRSYKTTTFGLRLKTNLHRLLR